MDTVVRVLSLRFRRPVWLWKLLRWLDVGEEATLRRSLDIVNGVVHAIARDSLSHSRSERLFKDKDDTVHHAKCVLDLFMQATGTDSANAIKVSDLRDFAIVFVLAGRDSTADTFTWFFYMLSQHPHVEHKLREELANMIPDFCDGTLSTLTMEHVQRLPYLDAAIKETLRLYPIASFNVREAACDTQLSDGTLVCKGQLVGLAAYAMARNPDVWGPDATEFKPERWLDGTTGKPILVSNFKFFAFHAGPRICLGVSLAMLELKLLIASLLSRFHLDVEPGNDGSYEMCLTLPMKHPLRATVRSVRAAASN